MTDQKKIETFKNRLLEVVDETADLASEFNQLPQESRDEIIETIEEHHPHVHVLVLETLERWPAMPSAV